jgi:hypothetical protein
MGFVRSKLVKCELPSDLHRDLQHQVKRTEPVIGALSRNGQ